MIKPPRNRRVLPSALCLIEVMINLVIVSILLLAVTFSLQAMLIQFRGNETAARSRRAANVALDYMLEQLRQAKIVDLGSTPSSAEEVTAGTLTVVNSADGMHLTDMTWRTFAYNRQQKVLTLSVDGGASQVVLHNVTDLVFRAKPEFDTVANAFTWRSVTIDLKIETADMAGKVTPMSFSGTGYARSVPLS